MTDSHAMQRAGARPLRLCHRAEPEELRRIRRRIGSWASQAGVPVQVTEDLQLAVGEAVANGVEHAYRHTGQGTVDVLMEVRRGSPTVVAVRVADHGHWQPSTDVTGYRGRGLMMIERLSRRLQVHSSARGTEVCFEIPYPAA